MLQNDSLLSQISDPADLQQFDSGELNRLASEIRNVIISRVEQNGGHLASNLHPGGGSTGLVSSPRMTSVDSCFAVRLGTGTASNNPFV